MPRLGCDVVDIARLSDRLDRRAGLLDRVFTATEVADARRGGVAPGSPTERARLAARFAAKEATRKALGDLRIPFHATEVRTGPDGAPHLYLHGRVADASLSLSHDGGVAMAVVALPPITPTAPPPTTAALTHPAVTT
jgi:holo-[acyl-carrier protein] synthase